MSLRSRANRSAHAGLRLLPEVAGTRLRQVAVHAKGIGKARQNQVVLALRVAELERLLTGEASGAVVVDDPRFPPAVRSRVCTQQQLEEPWYAEWCARLGEEPRMARKLWEHAYLARAADELGLVRSGSRGLGFGVGHEPLTAFFAGRGCDVVATDLAADAAEAKGWADTDQHSTGLDGLQRPDLCAPEELARRVRWRAVDMRAVPADLVGFDFCWSSCCFEHLGSIDAGLEFVEASVATLRPGGYALHTTEFTLSSDERTVIDGPTVFYRRRDLMALARRLEHAGHQVAAFDFARGSGVLDHFLDLPPYQPDPLPRLWHRGHEITSIALVIRRGLAGS